MSHWIDTGSSQVDEETVVTHWECSACGAQTDTERGIPAPCGCERPALAPRDITTLQRILTGQRSLYRGSVYTTHTRFPALEDAGYIRPVVYGGYGSAWAITDAGLDFLRRVVEFGHFVAGPAVRGMRRDTVRCSLPPESGHVAIPRPTPLPRIFDTVRCGPEVRS